MDPLYGSVKDLYLCNPVLNPCVPNMLPVCVCPLEMGLSLVNGIFLLPFPSFNSLISIPRYSFS